MRGGRSRRVTGEVPPGSREPGRAQGGITLDPKRGEARAVFTHLGVLVISRGSDSASSALPPIAPSLPGLFVTSELPVLGIMKQKRSKGGNMLSWP
jgi:hypothetical protein